METEQKIPDNFHSIITDFTKDLTTTFPEYCYLWSKWYSNDISENEKKTLFDFCIAAYPERFFDIIYQNEKIFEPDSTINTVFLPNTEFKLLMNCEGVSENTKKSIWKYLQLILFTVIGSVKDKNSFGESMNLFDGIDEHELQEKLKETMSGITDFFQNMTDETTNSEEKTSNSTTDGENMFSNMPDFKNMFSNMPNLENMQDHLKTLFNGKIGSLAKDMAEEISHEFSDILGDDATTADSGELMKKLMKNPKKIMDLMKTVGGKLDAKMKSGEISKDEIMKEASELLSKMKDMGGADQFNEMFKNLAKNMGGMGKNARVDTNALSRMTKQNTMRERLLKKLELKKQAEQLQNQMTYSEVPPVQSNYSLQPTQNPNNFIFRLPEQESQSKSKAPLSDDELAKMFEDDAKGKESKKNPKKKKTKK